MVIGFHKLFFCPDVKKKTFGLMRLLELVA